MLFRSGWPAISSQFGIFDACGFPKDVAYYFKSWWTEEPVLHLFPHWNWPGKENQEISVWVYSNCEEVELFLNGKSLGRKTMKRNSHLEWPVTYVPGTLLARGYKEGKEILTNKVETTDNPASGQLIPNRTTLDADGEDVAIITVQVNDAKGRPVPTAGNEILFTLEGPGKIIGVGNGDPACHESDVYLTGQWKRSLFNGLAQIIVQSTREAGDIKLTATSQGVQSATATIKTKTVQRVYWGSNL